MVASEQRLFELQHRNSLKVPKEAGVLFQIVRLKKTALALMLGFGAFGSVFIISETMKDHGGIKGFLYAAAWFIPMVMVSLLAWRKPEAAMPYLAGLAAISILISLSLIPFGPWWHNTMEQHGPIVPLIAFAINLPIAIWCWRWPRLGSLLLFPTGIAPIIGSLISPALRANVTFSIVAAVLPPVICSLLFWLSRD